MLFPFNYVKMLKTFFKSPYWIIALFFVSMIMTVSYESYRKNKVREIYEKQLKICNAFDNHRCENGGLLEYSEAKGFTCKCTRNYIGKTCEELKPVTFISMILSWIRQLDVEFGMPTNWWHLIPFTSERQLAYVYAFHQSVLKSLEDAFYDSDNDTNGHNINGRILPRSRPLMCPNNNNLPPLNLLYTDIFERQSGQFKPDLENRNLLFQAFYQYFILQFFDSDSKLTITASQLYGRDSVTEKSLRSFSDGKLKTQYINNEHYALYTSPKIHSNVHRREYLKSTDGISTMISSMNPMLFAVSTLWVREHNRVCDMLSLVSSPSWTDEQIYKTARKIVTSQMMVVMMNEILKVQTGHRYSIKFRPEAYHHRIQNISSSAMPIELILMMAVSNLPEQFNGNPISRGDNRQVLDVGLKNTLQFMISQPMGRLTAHNDGSVTQPLTEILMKLSREHSVQSFNNYRRRFGLPKYDSFYHLTNNWKTANGLNYLYKNVDDVDLLTGVMTERSRIGSLPTSTIVTHSFIVNAILTNGLTSEHSWKSDTFGGEQFFDMVKSTTLRSLVCRNLIDYCNGLNVGLYTK